MKYAALDRLIVSSSPSVFTLPFEARSARFSLMYPSLALMVVETTAEERRGSALGGFTAFFDIGFGLGAPLVGAIASVSSYAAGFWAAAGLALAGGALTALGARAPRRARAAA